MKRRVGKYKNKIIVEGDKNEFKPHEVSIKELADTGNVEGGGSGDNNLIYYKIKPNAKNTELKLIFTMFADRLNYIFRFSGEKLNHCVGPAGFLMRGYDASYKEPLAIGVSSNIKIIYNDGFNPDIIYEGPFVPTLTKMLKDMNATEININDYLEPITEEEFYNIKPE